MRCTRCVYGVCVYVCGVTVCGVCRRLTFKSMFMWPARFISSTQSGGRTRKLTILSESVYCHVT